MWKRLLVGAAKQESVCECMSCHRKSTPNSIFRTPYGTVSRDTLIQSTVPSETHKSIAPQCPGLSRTSPPSEAMPIELWSYGRSNGPPRTHFTCVWNVEALPNVSPDIQRYYNGQHPDVRDAILSSGNAQFVLAEALHYARNTTARRVRLAFVSYCGIHRSVALVEALALQLRLTHRVRVYHRDLHTDRRSRHKARRREMSRMAKRRAVHRRYIRNERHRERRHTRRNEPSVVQLLFGYMFDRSHRRYN